MLKKIGSIESEFSKKKMDKFGRDMSRYGKIASSSNKYGEVEDTFFKKFKDKLLPQLL